MPTMLMNEPEIPLMDLLPTTLHESGQETASGHIMGPVTAAAIQVQPVVPPLPNYTSPGGFGVNSLEAHKPNTSFSHSRIKDEGMAVVISESSDARGGTGDSGGGNGEDWADVTSQPLYLESDGKRFNVPLEWEARFRRAPSHESRYILLDELDNLGKKFVDELKRERSEAYYNRMHAKSNLSAKQKVTIRGRIHSKLNPFVKKQTIDAQRVIQQFLVRQIPLP